MNKFNLILGLLISVTLLSCNNKKQQNGIKEIEITVDWMPTGEYYGIYYAQSSGIFKKYGYNVKIKNGTGAADVATQIGVGNICIGTSTSDNILRKYNKGLKYSALYRIFKFNPSSIVTLKSEKINSINDLYGKVLGTNIEASPYAQFMYLINEDKKIVLQKTSFEEYPIGYGGAVQLLENKVDAFLAYTTNQAIQVSLKTNNSKELFLGDYGVYSYGLVLAFADKSVLEKKGLNKQDVENISKAVMEGYREGFKNIDKSIEYLKKNAPTLDDKMVREAILKIGKLNSSVVYPHKEIDNWVKGVSSEKRKEVLKLYSKIKWD